MGLKTLAARLMAVGQVHGAYKFQKSNELACSPTKQFVFRATFHQQIFYKPISPCSILDHVAEYSSTHGIKAVVYENLKNESDSHC